MIFGAADVEETDLTMRRSVVESGRARERRKRERESKKTRARVVGLKILQSETFAQRLDEGHLNNHDGALTRGGGEKTSV